MSGGTRHVWPLVLLTATAATADAVSYLGLGHVFPANMTGNTVLLATGLAGGDYAAAARSAVALGGFVVGAALAGRTVAGERWSRRSARLLVVELAVLAAAASWWTGLAGAPRDGVRYGLVALLSVAMGLQSGVVTQLQASVSTTFITGTWTAVSVWGARVLGAPRAWREQASTEDELRRSVQVGVLVTYFAIALAAGAIFHADGAVAAFLAVAGVLAACAGARAAATGPGVRPTAGADPGGESVAP